MSNSVAAALDQPDEPPAAWKRVPIGELGVFEGGGTPSKSESAYWNGAIPWVSPKDMKAFEIEDTQDHISAAGVEHSAARVLPAGAVLIVFRSGILAHSLPVAVAKRPLAINQDLKALLPREGIDPYFVAYGLMARSHALLSRCVKKGATVHSLEPERFLKERLPIPYPNEPARSLEIQRRIVARIEALLAEVKEARALAAAIRGDTELLLAAALNEAFTSAAEGWTKAKLGELIKLKSGEFLRSSEMRAGGEHPVYGGNGITGYYHRYLFEEPKVVIGRVGAKCGCVEISAPRSWITDNALYVDRKLVAMGDEFLAYLLISADLNRNANRAAQPVVSGTVIYPLTVRYPRQLSEQRAIVARLKKLEADIDEMRGLQAQDVESLDHLEQAILERAFRGEL